MSKKKTGNINVGGASVILILLVLALSVFALLALRSSYNERKLARKAADSVRDYYEMDGRAEDLYARIDGLLTDAYLIPDEPVEVEVVLDALYEYPEVTEVATELDGEQEYVTAVTYEVPHKTKENMRLHVELEVAAGAGKSGDSGNFTTIRAWKLTTEETGEYELELTD